MRKLAGEQRMIQEAARQFTMERVLHSKMDGEEGTALFLATAGLETARARSGRHGAAWGSDPVRQGPGPVRRRQHLPGERFQQDLVHAG